MNGLRVGDPQSGKICPGFIPTGRKMKYEREESKADKETHLLEINRLFPQDMSHSLRGGTAKAAWLFDASGFFRFTNLSCGCRKQVSQTSGKGSLNAMKMFTSITSRD
jgi:hypothetical protein